MSYDTIHNVNSKKLQACCTLPESVLTATAMLCLSRLCMRWPLIDSYDDICNRSSRNNKCCVILFCKNIASSFALVKKVYELPKKNSIIAK